MTPAYVRNLQEQEPEGARLREVEVLAEKILIARCAGGHSTWSTVHREAFDLAETFIEEREKRRAEAVK